MPRRIFNLASAASLTLFIATALIFYRSTSTSDSALFTNPTTTLRWIILRPGRLMIVTVPRWPHKEPFQPFSTPADLPPTGPFLRHKTGYVWDPLDDAWRPRTATGIVQIELRPPDLPFTRADVRHGTNGYFTPCRILQIPIPPFVAAFSLLPTLRLLTFARNTHIARSRARRGLCPTCAHNLTSTLTVVCPQCGASI